MLWNRNRTLWPMISAPIVWAVHFCLTYWLGASACAHLGTATPARIAIAVVTALALGLIIFLGWRAWLQWDYRSDRDYVHDGPSTEDRRNFLGHAGWLLAVVSAIGVIFVALPAIFIRSCI
ncbi:hypothetical protein AB9K41_15595 [Cribrihabitans sp. XS_ASV171]